MNSQSDEIGTDLRSVGGRDTPIECLYKALILIVSFKCVELRIAHHTEK